MLRAERDASIAVLRPQRSDDARFRPAAAAPAVPPPTPAAVPAPAPVPARARALNQLFAQLEDNQLKISIYDNAAPSATVPDNGAKSPLSSLFGRLR